MTTANILAPRYELGEIEQDHRELPGFTERAADLGMALDPSLWGWGSIHRTERGIEHLAVRSAKATLAGAGITGSDVDLLLLCSTNFPGDARSHGELVEGIMTGLDLDVPYFGCTLNRCTNMLSAMELAEVLVAANRYRRVLVVTADRMEDETDRLEPFALFSDGAASVLVSSEPGADCYELLEVAGAQDRESLSWESEISAELASEVNDRLLKSRGLTVSDVTAVAHNNIFLPIVTMKERCAGFSSKQLSTDNITRIGHCFAADPLINLADRARVGSVHNGELYILAASVPGSRIGVLLRRSAAR